MEYYKQVFKRGEKTKSHEKAKYHEMCGIRGESKSERAVRTFPLWKAVCASGMACSSVSAERGLPAACSLHWTTFSVLRKEKKKTKKKKNKAKTKRKKAKQKATLNSEAVLESGRMNFSPWHICSKPQTMHAWFLLLWFSVLGLHVFYSRWVSVSFTASVKYAIMLLNVLNVPKHGQGFAKQAWFGQRSSHFWGLSAASPAHTSLQLLPLVPGGGVSRPDTKHACRVWCYKQEIIEACKSPSSLPLLELLWSSPYALLTFYLSYF